MCAAPTSIRAMCRMKGRMRDARNNAAPLQTPLGKSNNVSSHWSLSLSLSLSLSTHFPLPFLSVALLADVSLSHSPAEGWIGFLNQIGWWIWSFGGRFVIFGLRGWTTRVGIRVTVILRLERQEISKIGKQELLLGVENWRIRMIMTCRNITLRH